MEPRELDFLLGRLRDDVAQLEDVKLALRRERAEVKMQGARASRIFTRLHELADLMGERQDHLSHLTGEVSELQQALEDELDYVRQVRDAADLFFRYVERDAWRRWDAYQETMSQLPPGEAIDPVPDPRTLFRNWKYQPGNLPPFPATELHDVNLFLFTKSGTEGVDYEGPQPS